jgi:hypothetical protein
MYARALLVSGDDRQRRHYSRVTVVVKCVSCASNVCAEDKVQMQVDL